MHVEIRTEPFEPLAELARYQDSQPGLRGEYGAAASFIGTMRRRNAGDAVQRMDLEHYPGMTDRYIEGILERAGSRWPLLDALVIHRVGALTPGDPIVLVAVWSAHRTAAFDACRAIMEELKSKAPFWKRETLANGTRWVERNTPG